MKKKIEKTLTFTISEEEAKAILFFLDSNALTDYGPLEEIRDFIQREFPEKEDDDE
ncbi:MAG: hypothetical protein MJZ00_07250 [Paludibacteraceae bacterium]|nr:hypothetical protein [Paludibacteraceae bacterium]